MDELDTSGIQLSMEREFEIRSFATKVEKMSLEQAQHFLVLLYRQMMVKDTFYQEQLRTKWGLESNPFTRDEDYD